MHQRWIALLLIAAPMSLADSVHADGLPVIVSIAGVRYEGSGNLLLDNYLEGEARKGDRVFYFDASLQGDIWTIHVSTSPKPGGYPSCWVESMAKESDDKVEAALSPDWKCAGGGAAAIEIDLSATP